jgi:hypothetical protein
MPLLQPPAEQPFSQIPPNWNPVSNGRVLPRLASIIAKRTSQIPSYEIMAREVLSIGTASTK